MYSIVYVIMFFLKKHCSHLTAHQYFDKIFLCLSGNDADN